MRHVPIAEFDTRTAELFAAAESGEEIVITRDGRDVLKLVALEDSDERQARKRKAIEAIVANREALRAKGVSISVEELIAWKKRRPPIR